MDTVRRNQEHLVVVKCSHVEILKTVSGALAGREVTSLLVPHFKEKRRRERRPCVQRVSQHRNQGGDCSVVIVEERGLAVLNLVYFVSN